jgi:transcriptional regulator with XRE-family HTH domain
MWAVLNRGPNSSLWYIPQMTRTVTLLRAYLRQRGLLARVAKQLGLDPSYVSRVANGKRRSEKISQVIEAELNKIHGRKFRLKSSKKKKKSSRRNIQHRT